MHVCKLILVLARTFLLISFISLCCVFRLGYTYLRLRDNYMEILNKDDEIERLVCCGCTTGG